MTETYEQSLERRARELFPYDFEIEGPICGVVRSDQMVTCGPMTAANLHFLNLGERTPEQARASACQIIREDDEDQRRIDFQVHRMVERLTARIDSRPWWRRLFP